MISPAGTVFATQNSLDEGMRTQVRDLLNHRLADAVDLAAQAKQAHWNVKGPQFSALHLLFDAVHAGVDGYVDLLAERIVQLGGVAGGTIRTAAKHSELNEYPPAIDGLQHVAALSAVLAAFGARIRMASDKVSGWGDQDSADICTEVSRGIDKWLWMVEAHGQSAPGAAAQGAKAGAPAP